MKYEITLPAENDLLDIWGYTLKNWGANQADIYTRCIIEYFDEIADGLFSYKETSIENIIVRSVRCQHHCIFFLIEQKPVIIAVLHEKMDFISALKARL